LFAPAQANCSVLVLQEQVHAAEVFALLVLSVAWPTHTRILFVLLLLRDQSAAVKIPLLEESPCTLLELLLCFPSRACHISVTRVIRVRTCDSRAHSSDVTFKRMSGQIGMAKQTMYSLLTAVS